LFDQQVDDLSGTATYIFLIRSCILRRSVQSNDGNCILLNYSSFKISRSHINQKWSLGSLLYQSANRHVMACKVIVGRPYHKK